MLAPVGIVISILLTLLAVVGIWEKGPAQDTSASAAKKIEKLKVSEYVQIIKENKPMQRLMVAGAGCKLALSIATNTTVLCMLYGCMMGNYDGLYLPMMVLGYVFSVPLLPADRAHEPEKRSESQPDALCQRGAGVLCGRACPADALEAGQRSLQPEPAG